MYKYLTSLGADVIYYLPNRLIEGYGVNNQALDYIKSKLPDCYICNLDGKVIVDNIL